MINLTLSTVVNDVTVEIEGDGNSLSDIIDVWGSFQDMIGQIRKDMAGNQTEIIEVA